MRIAIVGGNGTIGRPVTEELRRRGHEVRVLSRHGEFPVDLSNGNGLAEALDGCAVVVDASNSQKHAREILVEGSRRLLEAEKSAGVGHHVCVSIVGCADVPVGYFKVKTEQEKVVRDGPVPWTIVAATQFHEFVETTLGPLAKWKILPLPQATAQTVSVIDAAAAVADAAEGEPRHGHITVAGPEIQDLRELARTWLAGTHRRALVVSMPVPGRLGRGLRAGKLTDPNPDVSGTITFRQWLAARD